MTIIDGMVFTVFFLPVVFVGREEGVGLLGGVVDFRQTEPVGKWQCLFIDTGTSDDIHFLVFTAMGEGIFQC